MSRPFCSLVGMVSNKALLKVDLNSVWFSYFVDFQENLSSAGNTYMFQDLLWNLPMLSCSKKSKCIMCSLLLAGKNKISIRYKQVLSRNIQILFERLKAAPNEESVDRLRLSSGEMFRNSEILVIHFKSISVITHRCKLCSISYYYI
jgi:hypothetical protein